jgi:hypothetical protein
MYNRTLYDRTLFDRSTNSDGLGAQLRGSGNIKVGLVVQVFLQPLHIVGAGGINTGAVMRQRMSADIEGESSVTVSDLRLRTRLAANLSGRGDITKNEAVFKTPLRPETIRGEGGLTDSLTYLRQLMTANLGGSGNLISPIVMKTAMAAALSGGGDMSLDERFKLLLNLSGNLSGSGDMQLRRIGALNSDVLEFEGLNLQPGQTMIIDTDELNVFIDNIQDVSSVTSDSVFFQLEPGENEISFATDGETDLAATFVWQHRWL